MKHQPNHKNSSIRVPSKTWLTMQQNIYAKHERRNRVWFGSCSHADNPSCPSKLSHVPYPCQQSATLLKCSTEKLFVENNSSYLIFLLSCVILIGRREWNSRHWRSDKDVVAVDMDYICEAWIEGTYEGSAWNFLLWISSIRFFDGPDKVAAIVHGSANRQADVASWGVGSLVGGIIIVMICSKRSVAKSSSAVIYNLVSWIMINESGY